MIVNDPIEKRLELQLWAHKLRKQGVRIPGLLDADFKFNKNRKGRPRWWTPEKRADLLQIVELVKGYRLSNPQDGFATYTATDKWIVEEIIREHILPGKGVPSVRCRVDAERQAKKLLNQLAIARRERKKLSLKSPR